MATLIILYICIYIFFVLAFDTEFQKLYNRLDIKIIERGESFYQKHMESIVKELESKNMLEEDNGRKIMWGEKRDNGIPMTIVKCDGGFTYDTSDMAALKQRVEEENVDWVSIICFSLDFAFFGRILAKSNVNFIISQLIYVTDAGQSLHFQMLEKCGRRAGILKSKHRMDHVTFGVVLGEDKKKFKTRSGETVKLIELLDEGNKAAAQSQSRYWSRLVEKIALQLL